jgi:hypothetical protein
MVKYQWCFSWRCEPCKRRVNVIFVGDLKEGVAFPHRIMCPNNCKPFLAYRGPGSVPNLKDSMSIFCPCGRAEKVFVVAFYNKALSEYVVHLPPTAVCSGCHTVIDLSQPVKKDRIVVNDF